MGLGYTLINTPRGWVAEFRLDAEDCENIAAMLPASDGWIDELREAAARMRDYEEIR